MGIRNFKPTLRKAAERLATVHTPEGMPLPPNALAELQRDMARLGFVVSQIREIEDARRWREMDSNFRFPDAPSGRSDPGDTELLGRSQCSTDPGLIAGTWHRPLFLTRDRWFESGSLRRRVSLTGVFGGSRRKSPAFAGSVSLDVTRERDVLARSRLAWPLSLTGIDAVPPEDHSPQREELKPWPGHTLSRVALQLASRLR
jgi:hypothetical protein